VDNFSSIINHKTKNDYLAKLPPENAGKKRGDYALELSGLIGYHIRTQRAVFHLHKNQNATISTLSALPLLLLQNTVKKFLTGA